MGHTAGAGAAWLQSELGAGRPTGSSPKGNLPDKR